MKKILLPIVAIALIAGFTSCKKCKDCKYTVVGDEELVSPTTEFCGDELDEIDGKTVTLEEAGISLEVKYTCE